MLDETPCHHKPQTPSQKTTRSTLTRQRDTKPTIVVTMATLWQRAQASGLCPPSLLRTENEIVDADGFAEDVLKLLAGQGTIVCCFPGFLVCPLPATVELTNSCFCGGTLYLQICIYKRMR